MTRSHYSLIKKIVAVALTLCTAASTCSATSLARPSLAPSSNHWEITVAPYLWAINMNGQVTAGPYRADVNESFTDLLKHINFAGMLWLDASNNNFDVFLNLIYTVLSYNTGDNSISLHAKNRYGITTGGVAYQVYHNAIFGISPYAGFRYTGNDTTINVNTSSLSESVTSNQYWTDPIMGARLNFVFTKAWSAIVSADIGGTNASSQYSYNLEALLGYSPQTHWTNTSLYVGYRLLDQHYATGSGLNYYQWKMKLYGPMLGIAIKF